MLRGIDDERDKVSDRASPSLKEIEISLTRGKAERKKKKQRTRGEWDASQASFASQDSQPSLSLTFVDSEALSRSPNFEEMEVPGAEDLDGLGAEEGEGEGEEEGSGGRGLG